MQGKAIRVMLAALAILLMLAAACSNNAGNGDTGTNTKPTPAANGNSEDQKAAETPVQEEGPVDPFEKYETPVALTTVRMVSDGAIYPENDSIDDNVWYRAYKDILGITLTNKWVAVGGTDVRDQRMSVAIASGDLPEIMEVNAREMQMLVEAGMLEDLTAAFDKYASPLVRQAYGFNDGIALSSATFEGKIMGLPGQGGGVNTAPMIWVRTDWLDRLGLQPPRTMQDVLAIAEAFTKQDPDGNQEHDTFGLALAKGLYEGFAGIQGFMNGYHAYPFSKATTMWIKDASGQLIYGGVQPEVKQALGQLQEMYRSGLIDPEFAVKDGSKVAETVNSEKVGLLFGETFVASWPLNDLIKKNPNAQWQAFPLVSVDDRPAAPMLVKPVPTVYYVMKKGTGHPEAIVKMLNLFMEKIYGEHAEPDIYHSVKEGDTNYQVHLYTAVKSGILYNNIRAHEQVTEALEAKNPSGLIAEYRNYYDKISDYYDGTDPNSWWIERTFGKDGAFAVIKHYSDNGNTMPNEFIGAATPRMAEVGATLEQLELETFIKIIMGAASIDEFDKFAENWKKLGGDEVTAEVNEWYKNR